MSYNNCAPYDQTQQHQQYQMYQSQRQYQHADIQHLHQQQYVTDGTEGGPRPSMPRGVPPQNLQQHHQPGMDTQQYAAWNYHQQHQQNLMRYSTQPPTYPPPAYAYAQYHGYPQSAPVPTPRGGYQAYPQPPSPASVSVYGNTAHQQGVRHGVPPVPAIYSQTPLAVPPPPPVPPVAGIQETQRNPVSPIMETKSESSVTSEAKEMKTKQPIVVGKRRGGRVLPTGVVKKQKIETTEQVRRDPWSQYMHEVKRYKDESCEDDNKKNRPLVK